jgi:hypothetical protein
MTEANHVTAWSSDCKNSVVAPDKFRGRNLRQPSWNKEMPCIAMMLQMSTVPENRQIWYCEWCVSIRDDTGIFTVPKGAGYGDGRRVPSRGLQHWFCGNHHSKALRPGIPGLDPGDDLPALLDACGTGMEMVAFFAHHEQRQRLSTGQEQVLLRFGFQGTLQFWPTWKFRVRG